MAHFSGIVGRTLVSFFAASALVFSFTPPASSEVQTSAGEAAQQDEQRAQAIDEAKRLYAEALKPENKGWAAFENMRVCLNTLLNYTPPKQHWTDQMVVPLGMDMKSFLSLFQDQAKIAAGELIYVFGNPENWKKPDWDFRKSDQFIEYPPQLLDMAGLDPAKPESWEGTYYTAEQYKEIRKEYHLFLAAKAFERAQKPENAGWNAYEALGKVKERLYRAGFEPTFDEHNNAIEGEEGYKALGTTLADYKKLVGRHALLKAKQMMVEDYEKAKQGEYYDTWFRGVEMLLEQAGYDTKRGEGYSELSTTKEEFRAAEHEYFLQDAKRRFAKVVEEAKEGYGTQSELNDVLWALKRAGYERESEEGYIAIGTTKKKFEEIRAYIKDGWTKDGNIKEHSLPNPVLVP